MAGHVVAVASLKGGVGKTTTALYLAYAAARAGHSVLVVDADPQLDALAQLEALAGPDAEDTVVTVGEGLVQGVELDEGVATFAAAAVAEGWWVIIDTGPRLSKGWLDAVQAAELVVLPTTGDPASLAQVAVTAESAARVGTEAAVLVTRFRQGTRLGRAARAWAGDQHSFDTVIPDRVAVAEGHGTVPDRLWGYEAVWAELVAYFGD